MHDMWAFTGGCCYDEECGRYAGACGQCPKLRSGREADWTRLGWKLKQRNWPRFKRLAFVAPSHWMSRCAKASSLLRNASIHTIPYGIDVPSRSPDSRAADRAALDLPQDAFLIGVGAAGLADPRKGFDLVIESLAALNGTRPAEKRVQAVIYGLDETAAVPPAVGPVHRFATVPPDKVRTIVGACDVFLALSRQDNLPSTVLEAMAMETPTIAFDIGGMPDMIVDGETGYLVRPFDTTAVAARIDELHESPEWAKRMGLAARARAVERFSPYAEAKTMVSLYESLRLMPT